MEKSTELTADPFSDLDAYVALPRVGGLALSSDGQRLVVGVATIDAEKKQRYVTALWEVDPAGERPARRLTRGAKGEANPAFTPSGDLVFTAARPGTDPDDDDAPAALWLLARDGGEARVVATRPGGLGGVVVARSAGTVVLASATLASASTAEDDAARRKARKDAGASAILHEAYPVRYWDHDLGPDRPRLLVADLAALPAADDDARLDLRDLTGHIGRALGDESSWDVSADGRTIVAAWVVAEADASERYTLVSIDVATGERRNIADDPDFEYVEPRLSPDGSRVVALRQNRSTPDTPPDLQLVVLAVEGGDEQVVAPSWDRWPTAARWTPDGDSLVVAADSDGRAPLFRVDVASGEVTRLTEDDGAYSDPAVSPDGRWVYALRATIDAPAHPVRVALHGARADAVRMLPSPAPTPKVPGSLTEVTTTADDGTPVRAWLALPPGASAEHPAPLLLWIHGGPLSSTNAWSWRWNPWLATARGYAVLMPDPALSTGYGLEFIRRGWGSWGGAPFTDLMAITDAALERDDLDEGRTAAMGGSFGGYMANWVAGHTDRFAAIVTHASLWALDQFGPTTDAAFYWQREMTPKMALENSPHLHADNIVTPMLVIHGNQDFRVPIGEGLRLWYDLTSRSTDANGCTPHRFLYFPDENHWVLKPAHAKVWYATVLAFLDQHVLGQEWRRPDLLG